MTLIAIEEAGRLQCFIKRIGYQTVAGSSDKHLNNKKNSRQHKKMQTRQESFHYKSDLLDKWEI